MIEDEKIVELFFERSEQAIQELGNKYGKVCRKLSYNIVNNMQDAEECVNDAYLGAWNAIPPEKPDPLLTYLCMPALGAAIVFDIGASTGGTDIVALILAKYTSMEIGKALMVSDILIVLAAAVRFGMGTGLYCILGLIGKSFVVDGAIENIRLRKVCTIMTANPQPILDFIIHDMNRSATVEKAYGAYTHHELSVLVTVLTRRQALQLRNFLRENDPHSFITIVNSSEIIGKGFRSFN